MTETVTCGSCRQEFSPEALFCPNCGTAKARDFEGDPLIGTVVGERFLLVDRIGHGASGTIYRAEHVTLRRRVAVKVLHHELSRDDLSIERFRREATTVSEIDNEHIVQIHDFGRTADGRLYLAMEQLEGETLDEVIGRERRLSIERTVDVLIQLGEALMEAHAMGYIHRDLRPRNIYLADRRGRANFVKLLDFGLAKLVEREGEAASTSLGMTFGDPKYMSPEQARGDAVDRRADIYSMGCIAYEMLTGQPPFSGGKVFDILSRHVDTVPAEPIELRRDVPPWVNAAVMRMLSKDPHDRFITVFRLVEALRQGSDTGQVMSDERARRRESVPPPSVSRAMEAMAARRADQTDEDDGDGAEVDLRATTRREPAPFAPRAAPVSRNDPAAAPSSGDDAVPVAGDDPASRPVGKRRPAAESSSGISAAWFADGEALEADDDVGAGVEGGMAERLDRARATISPGDTSMIGEALYGRRLSGRWIAAGVGGLAAVGALLVILLSWGGGSGESPAVSAAAVEAPPTPPVALAGEEPGATEPGASEEPGATEPGAGDEPGAKDPGAKVPGDDAPAPREATAAAREPARPVRDARTPPREERTRPAPREPADPPRRAQPERPPREPDPEPATADSGDAAKAEFYAKLGASALRNGDILGAASNFQKARALDTRNVEAIVGLGEIALTQGSYRDAIAHLRSAARMRPRSARIQTLLGEAHLGAGEDSQAAAAFRRALQIDPDNAQARNGYNEATDQ